MVDLVVNTSSMIQNMTDFEITEVSGYMAAVGHTSALGSAQDHQDMRGDLVHGGCIHLTNLIFHRSSVLYSQCLF